MKKKLNTILLFFLAVIFIAILSVGYRYKVEPLHKGVSFVIIPIQKSITEVKSFINTKINSYKEDKSLKQTIEELNNEITELEIENNRLKHLEKENSRLAKLLETADSYPDYNKVTSKVIAKDTTNWYNTFVIDKGNKDGVYENMPVLASGGLVGKVIKSGHNYSEVLSLIDDRSSVSGISVRSDALGFVKGDYKLINQNLVKMEFDQNANILEGDEIVTSHLSEIFPFGISIGIVNAIESSNNMKTATIIPFVDFSHLDTVLVITENFEKDLSELIDQEN